MWYRGLLLKVVECMLFVLCMIGLLLLMGALFCLIFWHSHRNAVMVRRAILRGKKRYLIYWAYEPNQIVSVQKKGSSLRLYRKKLSKVRDVYICEDGILIGDLIFYRWEPSVEFKRVEIARGTPSCIQFMVDYGTGDSRSFAQFWIPIPKGSENEAETVLHMLYQ